MEYISILLGTFFVALLITRKFKIRLFKSIKEKLLVFLTIFFVAIICDSWLVSNNILSFNIDKLIGIEVGVLPIEEYIFYITVPYVIIVLYKLFNR